MDEAGVPESCLEASGEADYRDFFNFYAEQVNSIDVSMTYEHIPEFKIRFVFPPFKCCVSQLSVNRFDNNFGGLITLGGFHQ